MTSQRASSGSLREQVRTDEFVVLLVDGEVAQCGGGSADNAVSLDVKKFYKDRERLFLAHLRSNRLGRLKE